MLRQAAFLERPVFLLLMASLLGSWAPHPFYLSVTDLRYNQEEARFQGTIRVFTNDLEDALRRTSGTKVDLLNTSDSTRINSLINGYLKSRFGFFADGNAVHWRLLGIENEEEATWLYVELQPCAIPQKVTVVNSLLCDYLPQQMNIVRLRIAENEQSGRINCPGRSISFKF